MNNGISGRRVGRRQETELQGSSDTSKYLGPPSTAQNRSISPYRSLEFWPTASDEDLIDLDPPSGSFASSSRRSHFADSTNGIADHNLRNGPNDVARTRSPSIGLRHQTSLLDIDDIPPQPLTEVEVQCCIQCEKQTFELDYCNICQFNFCNKCWSRQVTHRNSRSAPGAVPHEKTNYEIAMKIKQVLEFDMTETEQEDMHNKDENTTWFGIIRERGELPVFQDYGRYAQIMSEITSQDEQGAENTRYPGIVCFVGQTGAGKSTLIKLIIDLNNQTPDSFATPIVGSVKNQDVPTSGDVHLYADPKSFTTITPILYADCEGLEGGEREPISARYRKSSHRFGGIGHSSSFEKKLKKKMKHVSEREITWANTAHTRSREFAVTNLYPRLLHTFSDVVVFVLKNPRTIESVFEKLVDWAAAALEKSSNQPVLPHAIIVLNACENTTQLDLWDIDVATEKLLSSLSDTVFQNEKFKKYALYWRERQRQVDSVKQLLLSYYSSLKVVRVPTNGRPNLINEQVRKLYTCIEDACAQSREQKARLRMLIDANELQPYLQAAFDHFACDLDTPFDFVQAAFINSPIPLDFGGNILKLAINMMDALHEIAGAQMIFTELSYMVASCIMLDSARHGIKGIAEHIFSQYVEHLEAALENFCDRHWPCEFFKPGPGGGRCVNVRSGHGSKGHQLQNGKVLAVGEYISHFSFTAYQDIFQYEVYVRLNELLELLHITTKDLKQPEREAAAAIHRDKVMRNFFTHSNRGQNFTYISHSACFSCLFEPPEHALPCGHVICTKCLQDYKSRIIVRTFIEIEKCPICERHLGWRVVLKPAVAGIRILTLDGGGIRGIVELEILRQIEVAMNNIPINSFFDLIIGTSTGGIIALGLAAKNWTVQECSQTFVALCGRAFTARIGGNIPGVSWLIENYNHSRYETQPLQEALIEAYSEDEYLFGGVRPTGLSSSSVKVAVTSTSTAGIPVVLANYNRICRGKLSYQFQRPEKLEAELKTWEAARATSAAPRIFRPMCHEASKQVYTDGGIYHNNPINIADQERKLIWPQLADDPPDIILSIGTSYNSRSTPPKALQSPVLRRGVINHGKRLLKIAMDHIASTLDSERVWDEYLEVLNPPSRDKYRYVRLNPDLGENPPPLDQVKQMKPLLETVRRRMQKDKRVDEVASQLIATSFYFEKSTQIETPGGGFECHGHIYCRLDPGSDDIMKLGKYMKLRAMRSKTEPYFIIQEEHHSEEAKKLLIAQDVIEKMIRERQFSLKAITVKLSSELAVNEIFLCIQPERVYRISRFPRSLLQDDDFTGKSGGSFVLQHFGNTASQFANAIAKGTRPTVATQSGRWASRSASQRLRSKWTAPDLASLSSPFDTLSTYSSPGYQFGISSTTAMSYSASFRSPRSPEPPPSRPEVFVPAIVQTEPAEMDATAKEVYEMPG